LQLSNLELDAYVEGELERNPLLQREEGDQADAERGDDRSDAGIDGEADFAPGGAAKAEIDARHDDLYADAAPGDRATGDAGDAAQTATQGEMGGGADAGGAGGWSKASRSGSFDTDGEGFEGA